MELNVKYGGSSVGAQSSNSTSGSNFDVLRVGLAGACVKIPGESKPFSLVQRSFALYIWLRKE